MPVIACVHHLRRPFLGPAAAALAPADVEAIHVHVRDGDPLPALEEVGGIIVLGGEQSVAGGAAEPALAAEQDWLRVAIARRVPVLGVCLGAQLLARALGGSVRRLPRRMLSWEPLEPTPAGAADPLIGALPPGSHGLHWNADGFDLPPGAVELVRRTAPSCHAFRYRNAWGVQFHPDIDAAALAHWYATYQTAPADAGVTLDAARAADMRHLSHQPAAGEALFGAFVAQVRGARRAA